MGNTTKAGLHAASCHYILTENGNYCAVKVMLSLKEQKQLRRLFKSMSTCDNLHMLISIITFLLF